MPDTPAEVSFAALLRRYRRAAGLSQGQLADTAGLSLRAISDLERDDSRVPRRDTIDLLARALGLDAPACMLFEQAVKRGRSHALGERGAVQAHVLSSSPETRQSVQPTAPRIATSARPPSSDPVLIGRASERALLQDHLAADPAQLRPLLVLAGEPGIGKTSLLREVARLARTSGWTVLAGGCQRRSGQEPYAPIMGALASHIQSVPPTQASGALEGCAWLVKLLPELALGPIEPLPAWNLPPEQERRLMVAAVIRYLRNVASTAGTLLVLDDLQWADADALDLLSTLVQSDGDPPLRVIGAYRGTEAGSRGPLSLLFGELAESSLIRQVDLGPLPPDDAGYLFDRLMEATTTLDPAFRARVLERTGGVPFFISSYAREFGRLAPGSRQLDVPWDVQHSVRRRLAALPDSAQKLVCMAAVIGRTAPYRVLREVLNLSEEVLASSLETACEGGFLERAPDLVYRFTHDVIREVAEAELSAERRRVVHLRIAGALERLPGTPPVEVLAYHSQQGGDFERATQYLEQAGDLARARHAHADAEVHYRELMVLLDVQCRPNDAARVREKLAGVLATTARYEAALALLDEAAAAMHAAGDLEGQGRLAAQMGHIHYDRGTPEEGAARLQPLLERLEAHGPSAALAMVYTALAQLNLHWGQWGQEVVAAERAARIARLVGDDRSLARAELMRGVALYMTSKDEEFVPLLSEVTKLAEAVGDRECLCEGLAMLAWPCTDRGEFQEAGCYVERAFQVAEQVGNPVLMAGLLIDLGVLACHSGEWEQARGYYARAAALQRQISLAPTSCDAGTLLLVLGRLSLQEGAWEEAYQYLERGRIIFAPQGKRSGLRGAQSMLAEYDILAGRPGAAYERLVPLLDRGGMVEHDVTTSVLPVLAWACLDLDDVAQADSVVTDAVRRARAGRYWHSLVDGLRVQALVALRQGQWAAAAHGLDEGLALARAMPYPYAEGRLLAVYGRLYLARADGTTARKRLEAALAIFRRLGARKDAECAEQLLATVG